MAGSSVGLRLCNWLGAGFTVLVLIALPVAMTTVGLVYMHGCPAAPGVPVYLMGVGFFALLLMGLLALSWINPAAESFPALAFTILILVIWFLYGSYEIYSVYPPNYDKNITGSVSSAALLDAPTAPHSKHLPTTDDRTRILSSNQTFRKLIHSSFNSTTNGEQPPALTAAKAYCHRNTYLFAFWITTLVYVVTANTLLMLLCAFVFTKFLQYVLP